MGMSMATAAIKLIPDFEVTGEGRRDCRRSKVMLSAIMMTGAAEVPVIIRDISANGALISTPVAPPVGSYVTVRRGVVCVLAQVVRQTGSRLGLRFRESIDEASLLVVLGQPALMSKH